MENRLQVTAGFYVFGALCILLLPFRWLMGALTAALIHEGFHCLAVLLCGGKIRNITLGTTGAKIDTGPMAPGNVFLCSLAGPLGSFCILPLAEYFPEAAICGLIQGAYNLIPIFPMDGGRALRSVLPQAVCAAAEAFFLTVFTGLCLAEAVYQPELGVILLLFLWSPIFQRKFSCNEAKAAVQ